MNDANAFVQLKSMLAFDQEPKLSTDEVAMLLDMSRLADRYGLPPSDTTWTPTYDLNRGAAEGWRWKAGKIVTAVTQSADRAVLNREQIHDHCITMAEQYRKKIRGTIRVPGYLSQTTGVSAPELPGQ